MDIGYGMNDGMSWIFGAVAIVGIVLLVVLVVRLVGGGIRRGPSPTPARRPDEPAPPTGRSRARQIVTERYARGEIDAAEYQELLQHLQDE